MQCKYLFLYALFCLMVMSSVVCSNVSELTHKKLLFKLKKKSIITLIVNDSNRSILVAGEPFATPHSVVIFPKETITGRNPILRSPPQLAPYSSILIATSAGVFDLFAYKGKILLIERASKKSHMPKIELIDKGESLSIIVDKIGQVKIQPMANE